MPHQQEEGGLLAAGLHSNIHDMEWTLTQYDAATQNPHTIDRLPNPYPYYKGGFTLDICWAERGSPSLFDLKNIQAQRMGWVNENNFSRKKSRGPTSSLARASRSMAARCLSTRARPALRAILGIREDL
jgi:hypothetical protein